LADGSLATGHIEAGYVFDGSILCDKIRGFLEPLRVGAAF